MLTCSICQDPKYVAKLKCYQKTMSNPYYKLAPIKEEIIHINPSIWMYHDIASPLERRGIIQTAGPFVSSNMKKRRKSCNKSAMKLWLVFFSFNSANSLFNEGKKISSGFEEKLNPLLLFLRTDAVFLYKVRQIPYFRPFLQLYYISRSVLKAFFQIEFRRHQKIILPENISNSFRHIHIV